MTRHSDQSSSRRTRLNKRLVGTNKNSCPNCSNEKSNIVHHQKSFTAPTIGCYVISRSLLSKWKFTRYQRERWIASLTEWKWGQSYSTNATRINFLSFTIEFANEELSLGRYFFTEETHYAPCVYLLRIGRDRQLWPNERTTHASAIISLQSEKRETNDRNLPESSERDCAAQPPISMGKFQSPGQRFILARESPRYTCPKTKLTSDTYDACVFSRIPRFHYKLQRGLFKLCNRLRLRNFLSSSGFTADRQIAFQKKFYWIIRQEFYVLDL